MRPAERLEAALGALAALLPERERPIAALDLETTGVNPAIDELLEVGLGVLHPDGRVVIHEGVYRPAQAVSQEILELTGISPEEIAAGRVWDAREAAVYAAGFRGVDFLGYNAKYFDLVFFQAQCARVGVDLGLAGCRIIDPYVLWGRVEKRDLSSYVARFAGRPHEGAHRATADIAATVEGLVGFLRTFSGLPRSVQGLHDLAFPRDPSWADEQGKLAWRGGRLCVNFGNLWNGRALEDVARDRKGRDYLEWMLRAKFEPDTKKIVQDFLLGGKLPAAPAARAAAPADDMPF